MNGTVHKLTANDIGAVDKTAIVHNTETADMDKVPSAAVTADLQDQVNAANGHFANTNASALRFYVYSIQNASTIDIPLTPPSGNNNTITVFCGARMNTFRLSTNGTITGGDGISEGATKIGASYAGNVLTLTGLATYTRMIVMSTFAFG